MTTHVSLRLKHASQDLTRIANGLGLPVARIWLMGDTRKTLQGNALKGTYHESYLALKVASESGTISGSIEVIRQAFLAAPADIRLLLLTPDLHKSLCCTLESEGEEIDLDALRALVDFGIKLEIEGK